MDSSPSSNDYWPSHEGSWISPGLRCWCDGSPGCAAWLGGVSVGRGGTVAPGCGGLRGRRSVARQQSCARGSGKIEKVLVSIFDNDTSSGSKVTFGEFVETL